MHDGFFLGVSQATKRVWLATPYFVPSPAVLAVLRGAAQRGLDVRVIVPGVSDVRLVQWASRSYYRDLLRAGIRVFEFKPRFSHAKAVVLDDDLTIIGSANVDARSFRLNFELVCFVDSRKLNARVSEILFLDIQASREVTGDALDGRGRAGALIESAANLLSPLL